MYTTLYLFAILKVPALRPLNAFGPLRLVLGGSYKLTCIHFFLFLKNIPRKIIAHISLTFMLEMYNHLVAIKYNI